MKAKKSNVIYNGIEIEVYQLPNGEYQLSKTQVGLAIEKRDASLHEWIGGKSPEALPYKDSTFHEVSIDGRLGTFHSVPLNIAAAYWTYWASKGNEKAMALVATSVVEALTRLCDNAFGVKTNELQIQENNVDNMQTNEMLFKIMNMMAENQREIQKLNDKYAQAELEREEEKQQKNQLVEEVEELTEFKEDVELYSEFMYLLDVAKTEICETTYLGGISCKNYLIDNDIPLDPSAWVTLSRRTASFYRSTKGRNPEKNNGKFVYRCKDVAYIIATIRLIMKGL